MAIAAAKFSTTQRWKIVLLENGKSKILCALEDLYASCEAVTWAHIPLKRYWPSHWAGDISKQSLWPAAFLPNMKSINSCSSFAGDCGNEKDAATPGCILARHLHCVGEVLKGGCM
uniref:HDC01136 n=1 Tax=Drosophila melanogaster TaxID=7227 RepID=Q6IHT1_DROME|nr:TPA_inf: HDC01136 [Drosophila melanogaster]